MPFKYYSWTYFTLDYINWPFANCFLVTFYDEKYNVIVSMEIE